MTEKYQKNYTQWVFVWMVCNAKCLFCNTQKWTTELKDYFEFYSYERITKDILLKVKSWATCIIYEWWDFTIHPDIFRILKFGKKIWVRQTIQTNWIKLADLDFVKKLKGYWVSEMNFSIHAFDENISEKIMWTHKWTLRKTIKGVLNCNKVWMNISNNLVLTKYNINQLDGVVLLVKVKFQYI